MLYNTAMWLIYLITRSLYLLISLIYFIHLFPLPYLTLPPPCPWQRKFDLIFCRQHFSICFSLNFLFFKQLLKFFYCFSFFWKIIYSFIFGCGRSSLLWAGFLWLHRAGATLCCSAWASHCCGFSCCRAQALVCGLPQAQQWQHVPEGVGVSSRSSQAW